MTSPSLVSVIIPTFNRSHLIGEAVASVLAQTVTNLEVIVVDDGSTDNTIDELRRFGTDIRVIRQQNSGVASARNNGVRAARGNWIAFVDSDDRWHPRKLERQMQCVEKFETQVCFARCVMDDGQVIRDIEHLPVDRKEQAFCRLENALDVLGRSTGHPLIPSLLVEKSLLDRIGLFDESLFAAEDTELIYRLAFLARFAYVDEPLVTVARKASGSLTWDNDPVVAAKRLDSYIRVQADAYWRLLAVDRKKANSPRRVLGYFLSRRAELACGAKQFRIARGFAKDGLFFARSWRSIATCLAIYICPFLVRPRFEKKWFHGRTQITR
jgi:glycosyltransferase involved in cell wall biosynthesis